MTALLLILVVVQVVVSGLLWRRQAQAHRELCDLIRPIAERETLAKQGRELLRARLAARAQKG